MLKDNKNNMIPLVPKGDSRACRGIQVPPFESDP